MNSLRAPRSSEEVVLAFDVGTSSTKGALVRADGKVVACRTVPHSERPVGGEQDPTVWWDGVCAAASGLGSDGANVVAVAFASQMLGVIPVSRDHAPLRPAILWFDGRAHREARRLTRRFLGKTVVSLIGGGAPSGKDVVPKLLWLRRHEKVVFRCAVAFLDVTGYLVLKSTGRVGADWSAASATGLLDARQLRWSRTLARVAGIPHGKLPTLRAPVDVAGPLLPEAAHRLGVPPGIPVAGGAGDTIVAAAACGAGAPHFHLGTSAWVGRVTRTRKRKYPAGVAALQWVRPGEFLEIAASEAAGACVDWGARILFGGQHRTPPFAEFEAAAAVAAAAEGPLFAPWIYGERAPIDDEHARASFFNLHAGHGRDHLARSIYEGVAMNLRWMIELLGADASTPPLRFAGGAAVSDVWMQIVADVTGRTLERLANPAYAGAAGAGLLGAVAVGRLSEIPADRGLAERTFVPDAARHGLYDEPYAAFRRLPGALRHLHRMLNQGSPP